MNIDEGKVGMTVVFGRKFGEKTRAEIVKVNRKSFSVVATEERGMRRTHKAGAKWRVHPSLCEEVTDA